MSEAKIQAESRTEFGKGAARRIRRADKVPAVLYGHGTDPVHITMPGHETMLALKHGGANALLSIELEGKSQLALPKQVQRDPIKGFLEHLDLIVVRKGEKVTVDIHVHVVGEVSVEGAEIGTQIFAKDLELPKGSTLQTDDEALIVNVIHAPTADELEEELAEAEAEVGIEREEAEEAPEEAAPAEAAAEGGEEQPEE